MRGLSAQFSNLSERVGRQRIEVSNLGLVYGGGRGAIGHTLITLYGGGGGGGGVRIGSRDNDCLVVDYVINIWGRERVDYGLYCQNID